MRDAQNEAAKRQSNKARSDTTQILAESTGEGAGERAKFRRSPQPTPQRDTKHPRFLQVSSNGTGVSIKKLKKTTKYL
jgi:hypothetical protein